MESISLFRSPLLLGFDHLEEILNRTIKSHEETYPPYNVEQLSSQDLRITLAVAGFSADRLEVAVEGNQLHIRGFRGEDEDTTYLHRGIATRQFERTFILAEGISVKEAVFENGLLNIDIVRPDPEERIQKIPIRSSI